MGPHMVQVDGVLREEVYPARIKLSPTRHLCLTGIPFAVRGHLLRTGLRKAEDGTAVGVASLLF